MFFFICRCLPIFVVRSHKKEVHASVPTSCFQSMKSVSCFSAKSRQMEQQRMEGPQYSPYVKPLCTLLRMGCTCTNVRNWYILYGGTYIRIMSVQLLVCPFHGMLNADAGRPLDHQRGLKFLFEKLSGALSFWASSSIPRLRLRGSRKTGFFGGTFREVMGGTFPPTG